MARIDKGFVNTQLDWFLFLSRLCRSLFWQSVGHPCVKPTREGSGGEDSAGSSASSGDDEAGRRAGRDGIIVSVPPQTFLTYFSV